MPFNPDRVKTLREIKGFSQEALASRAGLSQSAITRVEKGTTANPAGDVLEKIAIGLDCTMDYLYDRGPAYGSDGMAAAKMALDVFAREKSTSDQDRVRCLRAASHLDAPKTAALWRSFAEMVDMALGPLPTSTNLVVLKEGRGRAGTG
jgi:transcriptional regulator with XRE-family HTH domain